MFQPAEEASKGARGMTDDSLFNRIPTPDVTLAQYVLPGNARTVSTRSSLLMSPADSIRVAV